jgi:hypothetical protein
MNLIQKVKKSSKQALRSTLHLTAVHDSTPSIGHDCLGVQTKPWSLLRGGQNRQKSFAITGKRFSKLLSNLESWNGVISTLWLTTQPDMTHAAIMHELMLVCHFLSIRLEWRKLVFKPHVGKVLLHGGNNAEKQTITITNCNPYIT